MWRSIRSGSEIGLGVARGAVASAGGAVAVHIEAFEMPSAAPLRTRAVVSAGHDLRSAVLRTAGQLDRRARRARVVIGNDLSCHWILAPAQGARSLREIQAVAQARFAALFDERAAEWELTADWRTDRPFICAAVPKWVLRDIDAATPQAPTPRNVGTLLGRALELFHRRLPDNGWCCIRSTSSLALMLVRKGLPVTLRTLPLAQDVPFSGTLEAGIEALQREATRMALDPVVQATWLDLAEPKPADPRSLHSLCAGVRLQLLHLRQRDCARQDAAPARSEAAVAALLGTHLAAMVS